MYSFYIIYSKKLDRYYCGHTINTTERLDQHNKGESRYTAKAADWVMAYIEEYPTRELARRREMQVKKKKSRRFIEWLITQAPKNN